jgi:hypothetical protein
MFLSQHAITACHDTPIVSPLLVGLKVWLVFGLQFRVPQWRVESLICVLKNRTLEGHRGT